jgi:hypothetical protein
LYSEIKVLNKKNQNVFFAVFVVSKVIISIKKKAELMLKCTRKQLMINFIPKHKEISPTLGENRILSTRNYSV